MGSCCLVSLAAQCTLQCMSLLSCKGSGCLGSHHATGSLRTLLCMLVGYLRGYCAHHTCLPQVSCTGHNAWNLMIDWLHAHLHASHHVESRWSLPAMHGYKAGAVAPVQAHCNMMQPAATGPCTSALP